mgnify:FL=1
MENNRLQKYQSIIEQKPVKRPVIKNAIFAFLIGGIIGIIAEGLITLYVKAFKIEVLMANSFMSMTIVFITSILTGIGVFDKIGQIAGAGTYIPITGFSNSMTSAALEGKSEGVILGIMSNMFKLAGAVIVAGVVSSFVSATIIYLIR